MCLQCAQWVTIALSQLNNRTSSPPLVCYTIHSIITFWPISFHHDLISSMDYTPMFSSAGKWNFSCVWHCFLALPVWLNLTQQLRICSIHHCKACISAHLLYVDWQHNCIYTCVQYGHNASLTKAGGVLADWITICSQCVLSAFTPVFSCGQALSNCNLITQNKF